ncbi:MAG: glycyl-radical enzyme activating protein [Chlorobi bacterium]|nr:glycyl-radical enzyme activating protein [Chlorobiota bacterium]
MNLIFDIKPYAINDGPGIRLTIFFKGCPLSCKWCHNPESISPKVQKLYSEKKCIAAKKCIEACPNDALVLTKNGIITDLGKCKLCGLCAEACPTKAIEMSGIKYSLTRLMEKIEKERPFFESSGGGVTLSGGEPLMHSELAIPLLKELGKRKIHRCLDTTGFARRELFEKFVENTDLFLFDLKLVDRGKHLKFTGRDNKIIISNLKYLSKINKEIIIRIPFIKGVNNSIKDINEMAALITSLPNKPLEIDILPYHDIAKIKYQKLGDNYDEGKMSSPDETDMKNLETIFDSKNIEFSIGG